MIFYSEDDATFLYVLNSKSVSNSTFINRTDLFTISIITATTLKKRLYSEKHRSLSHDIFGILILITDFYFFQLLVIFKPTSRRESKASLQHMPSDRWSSSVKISLRIDKARFARSLLRIRCTASIAVPLLLPRQSHTLLAIPRQSHTFLGQVWPLPLCK